MNIFDLLELQESAGADAIRQRVEDKRRYFTALHASAPTAALGAIYLRRLDEIDNFARERGLQAAPEKASAEKSKFDRDASVVRETPQQWQFKLVRTDHPGHPSTELVPGLNVIGRSPNGAGNFIPVEDAFVSKNHCVIEVVPGPRGSAYLYDIGEVTGSESRNGVFLNGADRRLVGRAEVANGDSFRCGNTRFEVQCIVPKASAAAAKADDHEHDRTVILKAPYK